MTPDQLRILKQSFSRIEPYSHELSLLFYKRFFAEAPQLRKLFDGDPNAQHSKFMKVIGEMVRLPLLSFPATGIEDSEAYVPGSYRGGMLHGALGVRIEDFEPMKEALLWALANCPDAAVTEAEREAWSAGYDVLVRAMSRGLENWHAEQGHLPPDEIQLEPGQAFLKELLDRGDVQASERLPGHPPPSLAAFMEGRVEESESA
jgi:nitric oxide dioxygenase